MTLTLDTEEITSAHYKTIVIPKIRLVDGEERRVGQRIIHEPCAELKAVQREILREMASCTTAFTSNVSHAFTKNRSIVTMAAPHVGSRYLVKVDIKDFFPSIDKAKARVALLNAGYPTALIRKILKFCFLNDVLPQGAPTSPAIANVVGRLIDKRMVGLAKKWRTAPNTGMRNRRRVGEVLDTLKDLTRIEPIEYTRYADDLVFTSEYPLLHHIRFPVISILRQCGFVAHPDKVVAASAPRRLVVCGVTINSKLSKPKPYRRRLRAMIHRMWIETIKGSSRTGVILDKETNEPITLEQLQGQVAHVHQISPEQALPLQIRLSEIKNALQ